MRVQFALAMLLCSSLPHSAAADEPAWVTSCRTKIDEVASTLARRPNAVGDLRTSHEHYEGRDADPRFGGTWCRTGELDAFSLTENGTAIVNLRLGPGVRRTGADQEAETSSSWSLDRYGVDAYASVGAQDVSSLPRLKEALLACIALAPPVASRPFPDQPSWEQECRERVPESQVAACMEAQRAVRDIDDQCKFEGSAVGIGGGRGATYSDLELIAVLGVAAKPMIVRLAHSANPTSRYAAIAALSMLPPIDFRAELKRLATDRAKVLTVQACQGQFETVAAAAKKALAK